MNSEIYTQGWNDGCGDCDTIAAGTDENTRARIKAKYDAASAADAREQADDYTHGYAQGFDTRADVLTHEARTVEAIAESGRASIFEALLAEGIAKAEAQEEREAREAEARRAEEVGHANERSDKQPEGEAGESETEEDDEPDEAPKQRSIRVVVFEPGELPQVREMANELRAMQGIVGGLIECFPVGVEGLIGVCNDEFLFQGLPMNRYIPATRSIICGTFFVARDCVPNFCSVSTTDVARLLRVIA